MHIKYFDITIVSVSVGRRRTNVSKMFTAKGFKRRELEAISSIHVRDYQVETPTMKKKHTSNAILSSLLVHQVSKLETKDPISTPPR